MDVTGSSSAAPTCRARRWCGRALVGVFPAVLIAGCRHAGIPDPGRPDRVRREVEAALRESGEARAAAEVVCRTAAANAETVLRAAADGAPVTTNAWRTGEEAREAVRLGAEAPVLAAHAVSLAQEARRTLDGIEWPGAGAPTDRMLSAAEHLARRSREESSAARRMCDTLRRRWLLLESDPIVGPSLTNRPASGPERDAAP